VLKEKIHCYKGWWWWLWPTE